AYEPLSLQPAQPAGHRLLGEPEDVADQAERGAGAELEARTICLSEWSRRTENRADDVLMRGNVRHRCPDAVPCPGGADTGAPTVPPTVAGSTQAAFRYRGRGGTDMANVDVDKSAVDAHPPGTQGGDPPGGDPSTLGRHNIWTLLVVCAATFMLLLD